MTPVEPVKLVGPGCRGYPGRKMSASLKDVTFGAENGVKRVRVRPTRQKSSNTSEVECGSDGTRPVAGTFIIFHVISVLSGWQCRILADVNGLFGHFRLQV